MHHDEAEAARSQEAFQSREAVQLAVHRKHQRRIKNAFHIVFDTALCSGR